MDDREPLLLEKSPRKKGGVRTLPFILANEALEKMATFGLMSNMTLYLMKQYNMGMPAASNLLFLWSAAANFMPLVAAVVADSFSSRFHVVGLGSLICLGGTTLLWLTTMIPQASPSPCDRPAEICSDPTISQLTFLCASLVLVAVGSGSIRSSSLAFGVDQLGNGDFPPKNGIKERYFGWYYASYTFSVLVALTVLVYVQDNAGWRLGFAMPVVLMLLSVILFYMGSPFYVRVKGGTNLVVEISRVIVASCRNRGLEPPDEANYHNESGSLVCPSTKLRFLNKACIIKNPQKDLDPDGRATNPWSLCTVDRVEELKALLKVIPIWSTGMVMSISMSQSSFPVLQASSLDRHVISNLTIPAASFNTFTVISVIIWIILYDRTFLPLASRIAKRPVSISTKTRMGFGIFLSFLATTVTSLVEGVRHRQVLNHVQMTALWLVPQYCLTGFAEGISIISQNEFYFSELPRSMSSLASTLSGVGMGLASMAASLVMNLVDHVTGGEGHESWVSSDINKGHYDYYYLILSGLSLANLIYFLVCSRAYGPLKEEEGDMIEEEDDVF